MANPSVYVQLPPNGAASWREAVSTATSLPATGSLGDERVAQDTQTNYIWSGSAWVSAGGSGGGVSSLNTLTGAVILAQGSGITLTPSGNTITVAATGGGTVTSVGLTDSTGLFSVTNSPVTSAGSLTLSAFASQAQGAFLGGPSGSSGAAAFRALVAADIPSLSATYLALSGGTLTGLLTLKNGTVTAPATAFANSSTTGFYSSAAGAINMSFAGAAPTEFGANYISLGKAVNASPPNGVTAITMYESGQTANYWEFATGTTDQNSREFSLNTNGFGSILVMNAKNNGMLLFNSGGVSSAPFFAYEFVNRSNLTTPNFVGVQNTAVSQPVLTLTNQGSTQVGNFSGIMNAGGSRQGNAGLFFFNDVNPATTGTEQSHIEFWTATAGSVTVNTKLLNTGQLALQRAGAGYSVKTGSNCKMGTAVLVGGTVTVANTSITASSIVFLTPQVAGGTQGVPTLGTVTAGTSFVINSSSALDTSTVAYLIMEPS